MPNFGQSAPLRVKVLYGGVYLFLAQFLKIGLGLVLTVLTSGTNLVLRVIWQCDRFGTTPVLGKKMMCRAKRKYLSG